MATVNSISIIPGLLALTERETPRQSGAILGIYTSCFPLNPSFYLYIYTVYTTTACIYGLCLYI